MTQTMNNVSMVGQLVKKNLEFKEVDNKDKDGNIIGKDKAISGSLVIRTADGSENEVKYYAKRMKKDGSGESTLFKGLETVLNEYKTLEQFPNEADIVKIGAGQFSVNDYKGKDGDVKTFTEIKANFANRLSRSEIEITPMESKFEVTGVIDKIIDEMYKDESTGNKRVILNVLGYEGTIIPLVLTVPKSIVEPFDKAGFFEGGFAKFVGKIINTKEQIEEVEKMAFGEDNKKIVTKSVIRKEITSGNPLGMPIEHDIQDEEYQQALTKRKFKLDKIKNEVAKEQNNTTNSTPSNPFGGGASTPNPFNPFATK